MQRAEKLAGWLLKEKNRQRLCEYRVALNVLISHNRNKVAVALCNEVIQVVSENRSVFLYRVLRHTASEGNVIADKLAKERRSYESSSYIR